VDGGLPVVLGEGVPVVEDIDASVGHDAVKAATECGDALVNNLLEPVGVADVALLGDNPSVQSLDLRHRFGEVLRSRTVVFGHSGNRLADVNGDDVRALLGETQGVTASLPASGSRDEDDLAFHASSHDV